MSEEEKDSEIKLSEEIREMIYHLNDFTFKFKPPK